MEGYCCKLFVLGIKYYVLLEDIPRWVKDILETLKQPLKI